MLARPTRRRFLQTTLATGAVLLTAPRCSMAQPGGATLRIRRSALELPAGDAVFAKYAEAVKKMHELPPSDPRNWRRQAEIHADRCPHGAEDFLQWHRHYINFFEQICGEMIGEASFALPYWDWSYGRGIIPDAFFDVLELNVTHWNDNGTYDTPVATGWPDIDTTGVRAIDKSVGVQDDPQRGGAFTSDTINSILGENLFRRFSGRLEGSPHNSGHVVVGFLANAVGHIGSGLSPLDPLFWLHHCNVDRLWAQWQLAGNQTPDMAVQYDGYFVDGTGQSVNATADGSRDFTTLGYTYEQFATPQNLIATAGIVDPDASEDAPLLEQLNVAALDDTMRQIGASTAEMSTVDVGIPASIAVSVTNLQQELGETSTQLDWSLPAALGVDSRDLTSAMLADFGRPRTTPRRILAHLKNVRGSFDRDPLVNVFVNCPYLAPETPYSDPHWAGTFSFFGASHSAEGHHGADGHQGHDGGREFYVDLTRALGGIDLAHAGEIKVQLMAIPPGKGLPVEGQFSVGSIEILSV